MNPRYGWYNGSWGGYGGNSWYRPFFWGTLTGWGLNSLASGWGYGYGGYGSYYNPYYAGLGGAYATTYNYSQPVAVYNYSAPATETAQALPNDQANPAFDQGLAAFKAGQYQESLNYFDEAIRQQPNDAIIHEIRALALFAVGQYQPAAAALNSLLSRTPGMDWTTVSGLYGNIDDYTTQLRQLESYCQANPTDAAAYFVLAYQYLVTGAKDAAIGALQVVLQQQPKDVVARQLLDSLVPPQPPAATPPGETTVAKTPVPDDATAPETDLVGTWEAKTGDTAIQLTITEDSKFTWKSTQGSQPPVTVTGDLSADADQITMSSQDQGDMGGSVKSLGPDQWQFVLAGGPPNDPGLKFNRVK